MTVWSFSVTGGFFPGLFVAGDVVWSLASGVLAMKQGGITYKIVSKYVESSLPNPHSSAPDACQQAAYLLTFEN